VYYYPMDIKERKFGLLSNGKKVMLYTLTAGDLRFSLTNFGAAWTSLIVPSEKGIKDDILLGYSGLEGYLKNKPYMGVTIGRFANRICGASFEINRKTFNLDSNEGNNTLHSGWRGFDKLLWKSESFTEAEGVYVRFEIESPDGDGGFPGNLKAVVSYGLTKSNELICDYRVKSDQTCPVNLTNHAYFNLAGEGKGDILSHELLLNCSSYVEVDKNNIPTGKLLPVTGTDFDFQSRRKICLNDSLLKPFKGYDHCFTMKGTPGILRPCAEVREPKSGRCMKVFTTQPGVQFYTGNHLKDVAGKQGSVYGKHSGFCLETQHYPDTPNQPDFPQSAASPGQDYHEKAVFLFDV